MRRNSLILLLLAFLGLLVYFNSLNNGFHFDDEHHISRNPHIRSLRNIPSFFIDPRTVSGSESKEEIGSLYRPLLMVTHALNYAVGGLNPSGYHLVNLGFHVGSAFLIFLILQAMLTLPLPTLLLPPSHIGRGNLFPLPLWEGTKGRGERYFIPLSSALLFLVHPFNSEVVNYITARSSVMSAFFYLLAFYFWVRFKTPLDTSPPFPPHRGGRVREGVGFYIASLISFLLAILSKEIAITLPAMLLLYDLYFLYGSNSSSPPFRKGGNDPLHPPFKTRGMGGFKGVSLYLPFFLMAGFYLWLRRYLRGTIYTEVLGGYTNMLNQIRVLAKYLQILLWPSHLSIEHDLKDITTILQWEFLAALITLVLIIVAGIWFGLSFKWWREFPPATRTGGMDRRQEETPDGTGKEMRIVSFFIFWYFIILLPMIPVRLHAVLQENRGYLAGVGFAVIVGIGIGKLSQWLEHRLGVPMRNMNRAATNIIEDRPSGLSLHPPVYCLPSTVYFLCLLIPLLIVYSTVTIQQNRVWRDDVTLWTDAVAKNPNSVRAYSNLGRAYLRTERLDIAEKTLLHALDMSTTFRWIDYIHISYDLGLLYFQQERFDLAREHITEAIRHSQDEPGLYVALGNIYGAEKMWKEAEGAYRRALEIRPGYTDALARMGIVYMIQERYEQAIPYLMEALRDSDHPRNREIQMALKRSLEMVKGERQSR